MTLTRLLAAAATVATTVAAASLGLAGPAQADQVMEGVYTYTQGDVVAEWTIYPSCVPTVGDLRDNLELPVACRLHVAPTPSTKVSGGDARLAGGVWQFSTNKKDGLTCPDGKTTAPIMEVYEFDDRTMSGTRQVSYGDVCDGQVAANLIKTPFTLAYEGPLPLPVDRYPLYCEPGGLKRCF
ncbi:hypothetical protein [Mycolicibacterium grossiae]|uniref:Secreted protein n=1 Tax=Mycolicibacterium grossiae TaxID=1552759 RepID=A0A1E8Q1P8_9MYCO|nr:hypothetical protein [Mycolicibacterium grossiae]OFJ52528.1 hypothetical protein BEL07_16885 [Mycolicibacterium grossiae]QEM47212.1 hypothetical protein FZ046_22740 [Mycolicibacterium grossiae]